jgi:NTE family protein
MGLHPLRAHRARCTILAPSTGVRYAGHLSRGKRVNPDRPFTLVLSGGGLKGLAHIGVLRALEEHGLVPSLVVGSSIWSLIGAAWASGVPLRQMEARARAVRRRDVFQVASTDVAFRRLLAPALYRREPLEFLVRSLVGDITFRDLSRRLLVNTADLHSGIQVLWGLPGLLDTKVADAVVASCALPGIFPPRIINGRAYVDGAVVENLPVRLAAALGSGPILAVNVAATSVVRAAHETEGFAATYIRGLEIVMQTQIEEQLRDWQGPPLVLVQPRVEHISMFAFDRNEELLEAGYRATAKTIEGLGGRLDAVPRGMHPTRRLRVLVDDARCVGCGACVVQAPTVFRRRHGRRSTAPTC